MRWPKEYRLSSNVHLGPAPCRLHPGVIGPGYSLKSQAGSAIIHPTNKLSRQLESLSQRFQLFISIFLLSIQGFSKISITARSFDKIMLHFVLTTSMNTTYLEAQERIKQGKYLDSPEVALAKMKAYLIPFMSVAGDHAKNDMAGDAPKSWKWRNHMESYD
jgi:hypothetical protein